ncbi:ABC transporter family protein, partial [Vibrio parahaemolyticus IDH02640]
NADRQPSTLPAFAAA